MTELRPAVRAVLDEINALTLNAAAYELLAEYLQLIVDWNSRVDLVAPADYTELAERHLADSLIAWTVLLNWWTTYSSEKLSGPVLDIGTGAGLPGVVWAVAATAQDFPGIEIKLLEPRDKRVQFLKEARRRLRLSNVEILQQRMEQLAQPEQTAQPEQPAQLEQPTPHGKFAVTVCRALGEPELFLNTSRALLRPDGVAVMMIGPEQKLPQAPTVTLPYSLPLSGAKRALAIFAN